MENNKEPQYPRQPDTQVNYTDTDSDSTAVVVAERVVAAAFRSWALESGIDEARTTVVIEAPVETGKLHKREAELIARASFEAIEKAYGSDKLDTLGETGN